MLQNPGQLGDAETIRIGNTLHTRTFLSGVRPVDGSGVVDMVTITDDSQLSFTALPLTQGFILGLVVTDLATRSKTVTAGSCRDSTDNYNLELGVDTTIDLDVSGLGGLAPGIYPSNIWYYVYIIGHTTKVNPTGTDTTQFAPPTAPVLPAGYDVFRFVGPMKTDPASNLYSYFTGGKSNVRFYEWREEESILQVLTNGASTSYVTVSVADFVPSTITQVGYLHCNNEGTSDVDQDRSLWRTGGSTIADPVNRVYAGAGVGSTSWFMEVSGTGTVQYLNSAAGMTTDLHVVGFGLNV